MNVMLGARVTRDGEGGAKPLCGGRGDSGEQNPGAEQCAKGGASAPIYLMSVHGGLLPTRGYIKMKSKFEDCNDESQCEVGWAMQLGRSSTERTKAPLERSLPTESVGGRCRLY